MKALVIIMVLLLSVDPSYCRSWHRISRRIMKEQMKLLDNEDDYEKHFLKRFAQCRKKIDVLNRLNVRKKDTLFIYEVRNAESFDPVESMMWTRRERLCYKWKSPKDSLVFYSYEEFEGEGLLPDFNFQYQLELAEKWDVETIQEESRKNRLADCSVIYLTRIIFDKKSCKIDVTRFEDFCNFEREMKAIDDYIKKQNSIRSGSASG